MSINAKTQKRLAQAAALKAARDKIAQMSPKDRRAALRLAAARASAIKARQK